MDLPEGDYNDNDVMIFLTLLSDSDREFIVDFFSISSKANLPGKTLFKGFNPSDLSQHADVRAPFYKKYKNTKYRYGIKLIGETLSKISTIRRKNQFIADVCQRCYDNRPTESKNNEPVAETKSQSFPEGCPQRGQQWFSNLCWFDATVFATLIDPSGVVESQLYEYTDYDSASKRKMMQYLQKMRAFIFDGGERPTEQETKACFEKPIGDFDNVERALQKIEKVVNGNITLNTDDPIRNNTILSSQLDDLLSAYWLVIQDDNEQTMQAFGKHRKSLSDVVPQGMEAYAWVMPTSPGGSHFNCIYKCGNDYYLYDDNKKSYGENRIKRIDAQKLIERRNGKTCWIFCHKSEDFQGEIEAYGETKTNKRRRVENSSILEEIETLQRHFKHIGIGVRYSLERGVLPGTSTENTILIPAATFGVKVMVWNWVNKGIVIENEIKELVTSSFNEREDLSPEEKEKIVKKGYIQAHKHLIDVIEFYGRENLQPPTLPIPNIRFEIDKVKMIALRRKGGREGGFHGDGNYLYDILGDFVGYASEFEPTDEKSVYQRFEHPYTAEYLEYKTGRSMSDAASILAKIKAKLHHVNDTGNAWTDREITKTYTKTFHKIIAQELEQISKPSFGFLDTAEQHDALRIYEDIYSVNTSLANKMVREFQERVNWTDE